MRETVQSPTVLVYGKKVELEFVPCNCCGSSKSKEIFRARDERFPTSDYEFPVVKCQECGLAYLNPRPTYKSAGLFYPFRFYGGRDREEKEGKYRTELGQVETRSGKLLDIGCAKGDFVLYATNHGFDAEGLEVMEHAGNPHHLRIHNRFESLPDCHYDVVTAWAVFEHLHDPMHYFREISRVLKPGGEFVFLIPNFDSPRSRHMMLEDIPRHLYFYTPNTVARYLSATGLKLERIDQDNSIYYGGHRKLLVYLAANLLGKPYKRIYQENLWESYKRGMISWSELIFLSPFEHLDRLVHRCVTSLLAKLGKNGTIIVHVQKPSQ